MTALKLYVWREVFWDYTPGIAFALAGSAEEARELVVAECPDEHRARFELSGEPEVFDAPVGVCVYGGG